MGKLVAYISMIVFIDLLFFLTGQMSTISPTSVLLGAIIDPSSIFTSKFFLLFFGAAGIAGIAATAGVSTGILNKAGVDLLAFVAMAVSISLLIGDFILIFLRLRVESPVLAIVVMAPMMILFIVTITEWLRGKD